MARFARTGLGVLAALAVAGPVLAQSSTNFKLVSGIASGGALSSTGFKVSGLAQVEKGRASSANFDVQPGFNAQVFSPQINVTFQTVAGQYKMIGIPVRPANAAPASVFNELGSYDDRVWRLGRFNPATAAYQEPTSGLAALKPAEGYWLITETAQSNLVATGLPVQEDFVITSIPLANAAGGAAGWNQLGNPYTFPIDILAIGVTDGVTSKGITSGSNVWTEQSIRVWNPGTSTYSTRAFVNGREGFFLKKLVNTTVTLLFARAPSASGGPSPSNAQLPEWVRDEMTRAGRVRAGNAPPEGAQWALQLTARQGQRAAEPVMLGAAPVRAGEWNTLCLSTPPSPPGLEPLSLRVPRAGWGPLAGDYTRVFDASATRMSWDMVASGGDAPGEISLDVAGLGITAGMAFRLTDVATGTVRALVPGETLTLPAYAGDRTYRVEAFADGSVPATVEPAIGTGFRQAYPNPFHARTGLSFGLARGGDLSVQVFDLQGRMVRSLDRRGLSAGDHVLVWDGRDDGGRTLGSGVYLARWSAGETRGTSRLVKVE